MTDPITLPEGYLVRPATLRDAAQIIEIIRLYDIAQQGESNQTEEDLMVEWQRPNFNLATDSWVILPPPTAYRPADLVVAYQELWNRHEHCILSADGYVRPGYEGLGIGTTMLRLAEAEALRQHVPAAPPGRRVFLRNGVDGSDPAATQLHSNEGYQPSRYIWTMAIQLESPPPPIQTWPAGVRLQDFRLGQDDRQVFETIDEAFQDHWGYTPMSYELWRLRRLERQEFDAGLWFLAWDGDQIAGAALCDVREDVCWVNQLAVRRPWRRRGLGLALLQTAFASFFQRGFTDVRLGVDAENPTGATQLYEKAGMHVYHRYIVFDKVLRDGIE